MDLNADLGEGSDNDEALMSIVTSCNIACGGHAGDTSTMKSALLLAQKNAVSVGAHPSFPDRANFGRSPSPLKGNELKSILCAQILDLQNIANEVGVEINHVKPHGALYNMAAKDADLSETVLDAIEDTSSKLNLFGPPESELEKSAKKRGVTYIREGFADRAYEPNGCLRSRKKKGALILGHSRQADQAIQIALTKSVTTFSGEVISLPARSICVHSDTPDSIKAAAAIQAAFLDNEISICAPN